VPLNEGVLYMHAFLFMLGAGYTLLVDGMSGSTSSMPRHAAQPARIDAAAI
jgi:hypothetical protein